MANRPPRKFVPLDVAHRGAGVAGVRVRYGGGSAGAGPLPPGSDPAGQGAAGAQLVVTPPWVEKPPEGYDFNMFGTLTGLNSANTPTKFTGGGVFQVPGGNVGVIRSFSILGNQWLLSSNVLWRLLFNDVAQPGWDALTINPRAASSVEFGWDVQETFILIPEGALIEWGLQVLDLGTYQVSVAAHGWYYPTRIQEAFAGLLG